MIAIPTQHNQTEPQQPTKQPVSSQPITSNRKIKQKSVLSRKFKGIVLKKVIDNLMNKHKRSSYTHTMNALKEHYYRYITQNNFDRLAVLKRRVSVIRTKTLLQLLQSLWLDKLKMVWNDLIFII